MYLKRLINLPRTIGFRVAGWYVFIFTLSSLCFFLITYFFLHSTLVKQNYEEILLELDEISTLYDIGGIRILENFVIENNNSRRSNPLFVRVADKTNKTFYISSPEKWQDFDLAALEKIAPDTGSDWIRLPAVNDEYILAVKSAHLSSGFWIQVGMSCEGAHNALNRFQKFFLVAMIPLFILGLAGGMVLSYQTRRPIRNIIKTVQSLDIEKMTEMVPRSLSGDEMDELAGLFNKMLDNIHRLIEGMKNSLDNVAHDLRTPITRFRNIADMALQNEEDIDILKEALVKGIEESDHILKMLDTLMDISEAETGTMNMHRKQVDICDLIGKIADMYAFVAEEKGIDMDITLPGNLYISIDSDRMGQAISNILDNAVKFTAPGGHIHINAGRFNKDVIIRVKDTGTGISPEELPMIWDRLYRGSQSSTEKGLGLGLSLVKGIVEAHNGHVEAVSEPGKGSTFIIRLPGDVRDV